MTLLLEREALPLLDDFDELEFSKEAFRKLNHQGSINKINDVKLRKVLKALQISPFIAESVEKYKAARIKKNWFPMISNLARATMVLSVVFGIAVAVLCLADKISVLFFVASTISACATFFTAINVDSWADFRPFMAWQRFSLEHYTNTTPEYVLQTAIDIKELCPEAHFYIDELVRQQKPLDPFLMVTVDNKTFYYLEVWNEPKFKKEREV